MKTNLKLPRTAFRYLQNDPKIKSENIHILFKTDVSTLGGDPPDL